MKTPLYRDALSYYDQTKYFVVNLSNGIIPLWNHAWSFGMPNEFFMRRFDEFNPLYLIMLAFYKCGMPFNTVYMLALVSYFFLGTIFCYLIAKKLFKSKFVAFILFLLLLYSSLGTRLFDSFILLVFIPMCGFFYFLMSFYIKQKPKYLAGCSFFLMILLTTYVPFYFLTIFFTFLLSYNLLYPKNSILFLKKLWQFSKKNKFITLICIFAVVCSFLPGLQFMKSNKSELIIPTRQNNTEEVQSTLQVEKQSISAGGIVLPYIIENLFSNYQTFRLERVYLPIFCFTIFAFALAHTIKKQYIFWILWFLLIYIIGLNNATPLYPILYEHIFIFKYFRNSIFFTWFALIPIFIFFLTDTLNQTIKSTQCASSKHNAAKSVFLTVVYATLLYYLISIGNVSLMTYSMLALLYVLSLYVAINPNALKSNSSLIFISLLIVIPSLFPYIALNKNHINEPFEPFMNDSNISFNFQRDNRNIYGYIYTSSIDRGLTNLDRDIFNNYTANRFYIYDNTQLISSDFTEYSLIENKISTNSNLVYIETSDPSFKLKNPKASSEALIIKNNTQNFEMINFSPNLIKINTNFSTPKFLVYTDSFDKNWKVYIDSKESKVIRSNLSFKGALIPGGNHTVIFKYTNKKLVYLKLFVLFNFTIVMICYLYLSYSKNDTK